MFRKGAPRRRTNHPTMTGLFASDQELSALTADMFRTLLRDASSADPVMQADVYKFMQAGGVRFWAGLLNLGDGFVEALSAEVARRQATHLRPDLALQEGTCDETP